MPYIVILYTIPYLLLYKFIPPAYDDNTLICNYIIFKWEKKYKKENDIHVKINSIE